MCGLCKLNAAALDTTVACGYNGIDQHNLGLLPPIEGIDSPVEVIYMDYALLPPIEGIDTSGAFKALYNFAIAPHCGD